MARTITGTVTSIKSAQTVVVTTTTLKRHPKYKKSYHWSQSFHAHHEWDMPTIGSLITIEETRPVSRLKRWKVVSA